MKSELKTHSDIARFINIHVTNEQLNEHVGSGDENNQISESIDFSNSSRNPLMRGLNTTLNGSGCVFTVSVNASVSIGSRGSSEISKAQSNKAVFMNTDRFATCWPGQTLQRHISTSDVQLNHYGYGPSSKSEVIELELLI